MAFWNVSTSACAESNFGLFKHSVTTTFSIHPFIPTESLVVAGNCETGVFIWQSNMECSPNIKEKMILLIKI